MSTITFFYCLFVWYFLSLIVKVPLIYENDLLQQEFVIFQVQVSHTCDVTIVLVFA